MNVLQFSALLFGGSLAAGLLGALTGLGGGIVIVPLLALGFGVDLRFAIGASLVSVIATSSGAASAYVREGYSNVRIGLLLEIATTLGALLGAYLARYAPTNILSILFGVVLLYSAFGGGGRGDEPKTRRPVNPDRIAAALRLNSTYPGPNGPVAYNVCRVPIGGAMMLGAGMISGLLGIGSGAFKVLAMDWAMGLPFKVSTTTSNFMIGVTAAASAGVYLHRGYVEPGLVMPVMLGVLAGSLIGARLLMRVHVRSLRLVFRWVLVVIAAEMIYSGITGKI